MASPLLVVIQGAPGSGKTTLARRIKQDIALPLLGKDDIKEMLFEHLVQSDKDFSRLQGMASFDMLYAFARTFLGQGRSVIIEGAFHTELSRRNIKAILDETNADCYEIFCYLDEDIRKQRFEDRAGDGTRHPAHLDMTGELNPAGNYLQLELGEGTRVDTSVPVASDMYAEIIRKLQEKGA